MLKWKGSSFFWLTVYMYIKARLEAMTTIYGKTENSPPSKYKMAKDIQTPPRMYDYVAELSCCAKSKQNRLTQFSWANRGILGFFYSHTINQSNSFISSTDHKFGRIWNIYGSIRADSRLDVPFGGTVDHKSCLGGPNHQKPNFVGLKRFKTV